MPEIKCSRCGKHFSVTRSVIEAGEETQVEFDPDERLCTRCRTEAEDVDDLQDELSE